MRVIDYEQQVIHSYIGVDYGICGIDVHFPVCNNPFVVYLWCSLDMNIPTIVHVVLMYRIIRTENVTWYLQEVTWYSVIIQCQQTVAVVRSLHVVDEVHRITVSGLLVVSLASLKW